jgi:hypothetical protein
MKININDNKRISEIQQEFNEAFPYLQIQFFSKPHKPGAPSPKNLMKDTHLKLSECRTIHKSGSISITPAMSVNELEQKFQTMFGLSIQVFRKSGKAWLQTNVTDNWTLEEQNREGEALSKVIRKREIPDRDLDVE